MKKKHQINYNKAHDQRLKDGRKLTHKVMILSTGSRAIEKKIGVYGRSVEPDIS